MNGRLGTADGRWVVEPVVIDRGRGGEALYRVSEYGCHRGDVASVAELDELGVPLSDLVDVPGPVPAPRAAAGAPVPHPAAS